MRYAAIVEYDGTAFSGWQWQRHARSVQGDVEKALSRVANHPVSIFASGRTDAGVHACEQVIHFDSDAPRDRRSWLLGTNSNLPDDAVLRWISPIDASFHARFKARLRHYQYIIVNRSTRLALGRSQWCAWRTPLDAACMHSAAQALIGEHDFSAFRAAQCQSRTPMRCVRMIRVQAQDGRIIIDVIANAFLHHMVRNIVGVLLAVGGGEQPPSWVAQVLASRDRKAAGITAPACGLRLMGVDYPPEYELPLNKASRALFAALEA